MDQDSIYITVSCVIERTAGTSYDRMNSNIECIFENRYELSCQTRVVGTCGCRQSKYFLCGTDSYSCYEQNCSNRKFTDYQGCVENHWDFSC